MIDSTPTGLAKSRSVKQYILDRIESGELCAHDRLPTRRELAAMFGFSETTVRKALSDLEAEGKVYSRQGRGAFVAESRPEYRHFAMVIPTFGAIDRWPYVSHLTRIVTAAQDEARQNRVNLILYVTGFDPDVERADLLQIIDSRVDAAVIYYTGGVRSADCLSAMSARGIPFVMLDGPEPGIDANCIVSDNYGGARRAVEVMVAKGYREIWHVTSVASSPTVDDRFRGYADAMRAARLYDEKLVVRLPIGHEHIEAVRGLADRLAASDAASTGVFAVNGPELADVYQELREREIDLGEWAFACFDDAPIGVPECRLFVQVRQPEDFIGRASIRMMLDKLSGDEHSTKLIVQPEVYVTCERRSEVIDISARGMWRKQ